MPAKHITPLDEYAPLRTIVSCAPGLVCLLEADGRFRNVSPELCTLLGKTEDALIGRSWSDYIDDVDPCGGGEAIRFEGRVRAADGAQHWLRWSTRGLVSGGQLWVAEDVTAAKHSVHRVAVVLGVMRALAVGHDARAIPRVLEAICDADGWVAATLWWRHGERMTCAGGWPSSPERETRTAGDGPVGTAWATVEAWVGGDGDATVVAIPVVDGASHVLGVIELRSGSPREADEATLEILRYVAFQIGRVIPRWERDEPAHEPASHTYGPGQPMFATRRSSIAADRLAALGSLAGSVANEINNAMTSVRLSLGRLISFELSRQPMTPSRSHRIELMQDAREGITRVERITHELRSFASNESTTNRQLVDVRDILDAVLRVSGHEVKHRARVVCEHGDVPKVWASEGQLRQVFLGLILHAAHAIPEGEAHLHEIRVITSTDEAKRALVEISDDGPGIPTQDLEKVFDPESGSPVPWTTLGLSVCRDAVIALDGELTIASEPGRGTTVRVALPPSHRHSVVTATIEPIARVRSGERGRILIVDDDRPVAAAVALELSDYDVVVAGSGREALEYLRRDQGFDLVLCDLMMPEISGMDLFEAIEVASPQLAERFVFMTGGAFTERAATFLRDVANEHIEKPFSADELRRIARARTAQSDQGDGSHAEPFGSDPTGTHADERS